MTTKRKYTKKTDVIPPEILKDIKEYILFRQETGLPDDSEARLERAERYWRGLA